MLNEKEISVLLPVYDESLAYIKDAFYSVADQSDESCEIIIIDDNPQRSELKKFLKDIQAKNPNVVLIFNTVNEGLVYSLNEGLSKARGKYIARMDADDISLPTRFKSQVAILKEGYDFTAASAIEIDEKSNRIGHRAMPFEGVATNPQVFRFGNFVIHPSVMMRRDVVDRVGGYHEIPSAEDFDLWVRILFLPGSRVFFKTEPEVLYRVRMNGISIGNRLTMDTSSKAIRKILKHASSLEEYTVLIDKLISESKKNSGIRSCKIFKKYYNYGAQKYEVKSRRAKLNPGIKSYAALFASLILFPLTWSYIFDAVFRRFRKGGGLS